MSPTDRHHVGPKCETDASLRSDAMSHSLQIVAGYRPPQRTLAIREPAGAAIYAQERLQTCCIGAGVWV